jgi:hypothetical protein
MNDEQLRQELQRDVAGIETGRVPEFEGVFAAAEAQVAVTRRHRRMLGGAVAAVALAAVVASLLPTRQPEWQYVDPEQFTNTTSWAAPSDVLLPQHSVDIYEEIPVFIEGTNIDGGSLL